MKKNLLSVLLSVIILTVFIPCAFAFARNGGYNSYKGKDYKYEDFDLLRERLAEDGYSKLSPDDNPLADTKFKWNYLLDQSEYYEVWINDDDYEDFLDRGVIAYLNDSAVIIGWYEYREIDSEKPTGKMNDDIPEGRDRGTLNIDVRIADDKKGGDVVLSLLEFDRKEYYSIVIKEGNDYFETVVLPVGCYYIDSITFNETDKAVYDKDLKNKGFRIIPNDEKQIYIGFGVDDLPPVSWKDPDYIAKLTGGTAPEPTTTLTESSPKVQDEPKTETKKPSSKVSNDKEIEKVVSEEVIEEKNEGFSWWILGVVAILVVVGIGAVVIVKRKNHNI